MIRCTFFLILIINLVLCEGQKDLKIKLQRENKRLYNLIQQLESDSHSTRKSKEFELSINRILKKNIKGNIVHKPNSREEELRHVITDKRFVDNDYEDDYYSEDNENEFRNTNSKIEDDYDETKDDDDDEDEDSFLNDDDPRSDDPRHFLKKKFLMLKNLWKKKQINNTLTVNTTTFSTNNDEIPTYVAYITYPASELADSPVAQQAEPVENDEDINTGTPIGTGTDTGTITAQPADFIPPDLPDLPDLPDENVLLDEDKIINNTSNDPDKPDHIANENENVSADNQNFVNSYGSRAQTEKGNKLKPNSVKQFEIIEENSNDDDANDDIDNEAEFNDDLKNDDEEQNIFENEDKHKINLQQQDYIQQQIQLQLYNLQMQNDNQNRKKRKRKRKKKKKRPENHNEDENAGISYYTKYLPPNLRKLMKIRPTVYLRGDSKNKGRKRSRTLY